VAKVDSKRYTACNTVNLCLFKSLTCNFYLTSLFRNNLFVSPTSMLKFLEPKKNSHNPKNTRRPFIRLTNSQIIPKIRSLHDSSLSFPVFSSGASPFRIYLNWRLIPIGNLACPFWRSGRNCPSVQQFWDCTIGSG
jgi:hypothetical protein